LLIYLNNMKRILSQCSKELSQFKRDRLTLALAFLLPLITLFIFGFAIRLEAKNIPLVIQDFDRSQISQRYVAKLFATNQFIFVPWNVNDSVEIALDRAIAKAGVIIPPEFSRHIAAGKIADVQVLVDGTDSNNARVIKNSIKATTNDFMLSEGLIPESNLLTTRSRIWFNPARQESLYIVPGVFAVVLWIFPSLLSAIAMVREKERQTILQVYASSMTSTELILGKGLAYLIVSLGIALIVMGVGAIVFGLSFAGDPTPLFVAIPIYLWASVMFGTMLGTRTNNQNAAVQGVALVGFLTALLLSGFIYPLNNIPFPLSLLPNVIPARYFIEITRDAYVRGTGWIGVWFAEIMIFAIGMFFFNVARKVLSRMQLSD